MSVRERNKADKRERIKAAARAIFAEQGYERGTLRQIAERAQVALGTTMLYADDKRDLVLLMYNDEISVLMQQAAAKVSRTAGVVDNLCRFSKVFYVCFAKNLSLSRTYLQMNFFADSMNTLGLEQNRRRKLDLLERIYQIGQDNGEIRLDVDVKSMAATSLLLHRAAVRSWVAEAAPEPADGVARFRAMLTLLMEGFGPPAAGGSAPKPKRSLSARSR